MTTAGNLANHAIQSAGWAHGSGQPNPETIRNLANAALQLARAVQDLDQRVQRIEAHLSGQR